MTLWINGTPELLEAYVPAAGHTKSVLMQNKWDVCLQGVCFQARCCHMVWLFEWNPRWAPGTCMLHEQWQGSQKRYPNPTSAEQGRNDRKYRGQNWIWTLPTSGDKLPEGNWPKICSGPRAETSPQRHATGYICFSIKKRKRNATAIPPYSSCLIKISWSSKENGVSIWTASAPVWEGKDLGPLQPEGSAQVLY